jgi:bis(5'-nucleosyl)-tetraphosphatase (symmetrical)
LQRLLEKANFDKEHDCLCFCGDLVNRGEDSLSVLRFAKSLPNSVVVLGNHDITLLAIAAGVVDLETQPTLKDFFAASDAADIISWLRKQPLMFLDESQKWAMVHAGIPPQWNLLQAKKYADDIQAQLSNPDKTIGDHYLQVAFEHKIKNWNELLSLDDKRCYITNALTRIRFCDAKGNLDLKSKQLNSVDDSVYAPWFSFPQLDLCGYKLCFGHWAALLGKCPQENIHALDTGYVWGNSLTMLRLQDEKLFSVAAEV